MNYNNYIRINTDNLKYNINYCLHNYNYKYFIFDVSNNAYNHGMYLINFLDKNINYLYVNNFNDVKLIRKYNTNIPIIMESNWSIDNILDFINNDVIIIINSLEELKIIKNENLYAPLNIILNIDVNGLLGFSTKDEIKDAIEIIKDIDKLNLLGIKTKVSEKDYNEFMNIINPLLRLDLKLFILNNEDDKNKIKHSNAIILNKSIYGINENKYKLFSKFDNSFKQIFELNSKIIKIKKEVKGKKVKYIGIMPFGYLNGITKNINKVWINNNLYNILEIKDNYSLILVDEKINVSDLVFITSYQNPLENYIENSLLYFNILNNNFPILYNDYCLEKTYVY